MVPVRIELKNFMSYGENVTPLDLTGIHLACLCGDNGHGKSALLDAVTWALWGEARASSDELIRLGAEEMRVVFDFELGGDLYRVIRVRSRRNSGNLWEVYIAQSDQSDSSDVSDRSEMAWRPLTGQGIRDTGRIIQKILRMDYKTFINSAYIQQGRADEFTKQTVSDRKKILADILDLGRYDALEQKAKERRSRAEQRAQELEREIAQIESELANEDAYRSQLEESSGARQALEAEIARVESRHRDLQARHAELEAAARRAKELEAESCRHRAEVESLRAQKSEQERRVTAGREIVKDRERILTGHTKLVAAREQVGVLDGRLEELRSLEHERAGLDQQIAAEKHRLGLERESLGRELADLESKIAGAGDVEKEVASFHVLVSDLDALEARLKELQEKVTRQSDRLGELKANYERTGKERDELDEKLRMISGPGALCPLCQTELSPEKYESLIADYRGHMEKTKRQIEELKRAGLEAKGARDAAQKAMAEIEEKLRAGLEVRRQLAQSEQILVQIDEYQRKVPEVKSRVTSLAEKLESGDFAKEARSKLNLVEGHVASLEYDPGKHRRLKDELAVLADFESLALKLKHAEESLPADESNLKAIADLISAREQSIAECERAIREMSKSLEELQTVVSEMAGVSAVLASKREEDREITGRIATLEHSLERCKALRKESTKKRKELERMKKDRAAYADLAAAFGKKGVQALIIENAVPEIQEEANRLLARMTDNAMQVSIETVRDKKTGGTAETLNIRISDDMGTRAYELYSGGEAFRINFALRIALSKLLARRAGARLQTLIIDEGFGTQDGKGREKLVEAINSIRDDFEKILVITHIDELKDAFPTRIEITKDSQGSQISVN